MSVHLKFLELPGAKAPFSGQYEGKGLSGEGTSADAQRKQAAAVRNGILPLRPSGLWFKKKKKRNK